MEFQPTDPARRPDGLISVVAPVYNEADVLEEFHRRVCAALDGTSFELVLIDDGSSDATPEILEGLADRDERVRILTLSRNFGHQAAITAGLDHATGDAVVAMDADLQDPPEVIPEMIEQWRRGIEVVYATRRTRSGESRAKLGAKRWFYRLFGRVSEIDFTHDSGDFRLLDRRPLDALCSMRERTRFLRGMTVWVGFTQAAIPYDRDPRFGGESKYTLGRLVRLALDGLTSFSRVPLRIATLLGLTFSAVAFLGIPVAIGFKIAGQFVPGITTVLFAVLLIGGIQLITVGIIGEYLGQVYEEVKRRPLYIVREHRNLPGGANHEDVGQLEGERTPSAL